MTTRVRISNLDTSHSIINVNKGTEKHSINVAELKPGESHEDYVWGTTALTIVEQYTHND